MDVKTEPRSDYIYVRMSGDWQADVPIEGHPDAMARACSQANCQRLLVDVRELTGNMDTLVIFHRGEKIAKVFAFSSIQIAIVGTKERVHMLSFFENVIVNRGAVLRVFTDIDEATEWLARS
jgi:hypothetical protein